jgi:hypothetical protein
MVKLILLSDHNFQSDIIFLGFGRASGEAFIQKEAADMLQTFRNSEGQPLDNHVPFAAAGKISAWIERSID